MYFTLLVPSERRARFWWQPRWRWQNAIDSVSLAAAGRAELRVKPQLLCRESAAAAAATATTAGTATAAGAAWRRGHRTPRAPHRRFWRCGGGTVATPTGTVADATVGVVAATAACRNAAAGLGRLARREQAAACRIVYLHRTHRLPWSRG